MVKCQICNEEYNNNSEWFAGYCDNTLECALDEGEHLVTV